jgi:hypothetical protein
LDLTGIPFTKVYRSILTSSVWTTPHPRLHMIRCVWMALLFMADSKGHVHASVPGLAAAAVVTLEECEEALALFLAPDRYSRTEEHEGRKIEKTKGGWRLLNYSAYRETARVELARESKREWYYRHRDASKTRDPNLVSSSLDNSWRSPSLSSSLSDPDQSLEDPDQSGSTRTEATLAADRARIKADTDEGLAAFGEALARQVSGALPEARGQRVVHRSLDGWEPRPSSTPEQRRSGLPREVVDQRIADLRNGPIGGRRGVFDRDDYVLRQLPTWKVWHETAQSQAVHRAGSTSGGSGGSRRGGAARPVLEPTGKHRAFAKLHGLDLDAIVREIDRSDVIDTLGLKQAEVLLGQKMSLLVRAKRAAGKPGGSG